jgi:hypothetical protein
MAIVCGILGFLLIFLWRLDVAGEVFLAIAVIALCLHLDRSREWHELYRMRRQGRK